MAGGESCPHEYSILFQVTGIFVSILLVASSVIVASFLAYYLRRIKSNTKWQIILFYFISFVMNFSRVSEIIISIFYLQCYEFSDPTMSISTVIFAWIAEIFNYGIGVTFVTIMFSIMQSFKQMRTLDQARWLHH